MAADRQGQIDTEAFRMAAEALTLVRAHKDECDRYRAMTAAGLGRIEDALGKLSDKLSSEVGALHSRIGAAIVERHAAVGDARDRIADGERKTLRVWIAMLIGALAAAGGLIAWLADRMPWVPW